MKIFRIVFIVLILAAFTLPCLCQEKVEIEGAIVIGNSEALNPVPGTVRFNKSTNDFEGWTGQEWRSLTIYKKEVVGVSVGTTDGKIDYAGLTGVRAANQMCKDAFPSLSSVRFYFEHDINEALGNELISGVTNNIEYWTIANSFDNLASLPNQTQSGNCLCMLNNAGDVERGTTVTFHMNEVTFGNGGGTLGDRINFKRERPCGNQYRVVCGK